MEDEPREVVRRRGWARRRVALMAGGAAVAVLVATAFAGSASGRRVANPEVPLAEPPGAKAGRAAVVTLSENGRLLGGTAVDEETENTNAVMWRCG